MELSPLVTVVGEEEQHVLDGCGALQSHGARTRSIPKRSPFAPGPVVQVTASAMTPR